MGEAAIDDRYWQAEECLKVCESFEYFLDEYVWIEDKINQTPIKLNLWDSQREKIPELLSNRLVIILKAHQLGYTWIFVAAYCLWRAITEAMHHIVVNSFNEIVGTEILIRMDFIIDRLPTWLYPNIKKETTLQKEFLHKDHETGITKPSVVQVIPATEKGTQSKTPTILIVDESAQNRYVRKTYMASKPGIDMANGQIIIISNSIKDAPGWGFTRDIYTKSMKGQNAFHRIFLPWQANPLRTKNFKQIQLNEGMSPEDFIQRYPETEEQAISAITGGYFADTLARHQATTEAIKPVTGYLRRSKKTKEVEFVPEEGGIVSIWRYPYFETTDFDGYHWVRRYAIGSDVSEGLGQSYSVAYVIDRHYDELVCRIRTNRLDAVQWEDQLLMLSEWYRSAESLTSFVKALTCVERTGAGQTTVKELAKHGANQYLKVIPDKIGSGITKQYGWSESEQSKHELCGDLKHWFRITTGGFYCPVLLDEASTTIKHEGTRRIGPEDDTRLWDCVVAAGCTIQASMFLEGPPEKLIPEPDGWRKRLREEGKSAWAR